MKEILKLNAISSKVNDILTSDMYNVCDSSEKPEAIILRSFSMHEYAMADSVLAVARAGAGVNNIPIPQMTEKGVCVFNTPGANANAVKELVLCALLLGSRKIVEAINWTQSLASDPDMVKTIEKGKKAFIGPEITGKTLGIIGLGAIGRLVANAVINLGMNVIGYDPFLSENAAKQLDSSVKVVKTLDEIYAVSDYITVHVPATNETKGFINKDSIAKMKDGVVIINCARGDLFNDDDVVAAVNSKKISRVITDLPNPKMLNNANIVTFPHLGASTPEAEDNCAVMAANELKDYLENGNVTNSVNFPNAKLSNKCNRITVLANTENAVNSASKTIMDLGFEVKASTNATRGALTYMIFDLNKEASDKLVSELSKAFVKVRKF